VNEINLAGALIMQLGVLHGSHRKQACGVGI